MIELKGLDFAYGDRPVIQGASAAFKKGELWAVVGPNGSGKTTLLRLMGRLLSPERGTLFMDGKPYFQYGRREFARRLALLPQSRSTPAISVWDLVCHGRFPYLDLSRRLSRADTEAVRRAISSMGMEDYAPRRLSELSGGERQRAYLALLLAQDTPCVLLDEPTTYLDISSQFAVMETLRRMSGEGRCVVAVLHDLALALRFCDGLCVLDGGRVAACGTPGEMVKAGILDRVFQIRCEAAGVPGEREYVIRPAEKGPKKL